MAQQQPLWLSLLAAGGIAAIVSGFVQWLIWHLQGRRDRRTWARTSKLDVAKEFITACAALRDASAGRGSAMVRLNQSQDRSGAAQDMFKAADLSREQARVRSVDALAVMRLCFPSGGTIWHDYWQHCGAMQEAHAQHWKDNDDKRDAVVREVSKELGLD